MFLPSDETWNPTARRADVEVRFVTVPVVGSTAAKVVRAFTELAKATMSLPLVMSADIRKGMPGSVTCLVIAIELVFRNVSSLSAVESTATVLIAEPLSKTATCHPPARKLLACSVLFGVMPGIDCEAGSSKPPEMLTFQRVGVPLTERVKASVSAAALQVEVQHFAEKMLHGQIV